jgi:glycosyltransferase involved in cell wall biosynthesis
MRVAIVTGAKGWRGSVTSFVKVAEGLTARGHEALFLTAQGPVPERLRALGHAVEVLGARNTGPAEVWRLHRFLRTHAIDAIYVDTPRDLRLAAYAGVLRRRPVAYRYNVLARAPRGKFGDRLFARAVNALVVQSAWVDEKVRRDEPWLAARGVVRIPNGFDTDHFRPLPEAGASLRRSLGLGRDTPTILCASVFAPGKRQEFVIEAIRILRARRPEVVLLLAGGDPALAPFRTAAKASGIDIRWLGRPHAEELPAIYAAADVVAQPSEIEGFGNVVGEAMACGRAVILPDIGSGVEVAGEDGVLAPSRDANAWASAIEALLDDPERRVALGQRARQRILREFPLTRMQEAHTAMFESLVASER